MAGKYGAASAWMQAAGYNMIANKLQALRYKLMSMNEATHGLGDVWAESTPVGLSEGEIVQEGAFFDTTSGYIHDMQAGYPEALTPQSTARVVCMGNAGQTIGEPFAGFQGAFQVDYEPISEVGKLHRANVTHKVTGTAEHGVILHTTGAAETADANTEGSSVDNTVVPQRVVPITSSATNDRITCPAPHGLSVGDTILISGHSGSTPSINSIQTVASVQSETVFTITTDVTTGGTGGSFVRAETNAGGAGYLQWHDLSLGGHTALQITFRHSVDNATFADLLAMTAQTAARGAERKTVSGEVRRYLAVALDFTGAGSSPTVRYFAGFARNP
jgi:hypothetical protein